MRVEQFARLPASSYGSKLTPTAVTNIALTLVNSGAKLFHDVASFLPGCPLSARFSPTLTVNSHTWPCGVGRDQDSRACGCLFEWPRCNGRCH